MKANQTIDEARKYLLYVSDALHAVAETHSIDREDREVLNKFSSDLFEYSNGLEQLRNNIIAREQTKRKVQITAELEETYEYQKRITKKAANNVRIVKAGLENARKSGLEKDIEEAKRRVEYYVKQHMIAGQLELNAKRAFEQGA